MSSEGGTLLTFYSYKGGVGRSMALANVASLLANWGHSVLVMDWDLEAPGLERYFSGDGILAGHRSQVPGILDIITGFADGKPLEWKNAILKAFPFGMDAGAVHLITAGNQSELYASRLQRVQWNKLFADSSLGAYLEELRQEWAAEYDFVLIDSRTGVTDIGGICTVQLPDALVLFFSANDQSLEGAASVVAAAREQRKLLPIDRDLLLAVPVPSRVDKWSEIETGRFWKNKIAARMSEYYLDWLPPGSSPGEVLDQLILPYISYWSFGERLPVVEEGTTDKYGLGSAYELLAKLIENKLDWRAVAGKVAQRRVSPSYEIAEAAFQSLPTEKKHLAWPVLSRAIVRPAEFDVFGGDLRAVARVFNRAGLINANDQLEDSKLVDEWARLAEWIAADQELLSFLRRLRGRKGGPSSELVDYGTSFILKDPADIAMAKAYYPSRRLFFTKDELDTIRTGLINDVLPEARPSPPAIRDAEAAETFCASLSAEQQDQVMTVLSILLDRRVVRDDLAHELTETLAEMFRSGLITTEIFSTVQLTDPDLLIVWPRLNQWIRRMSELLSVREAVSYARKRWSESGQHPSFLLLNDLLSRAQTQLKDGRLYFTVPDVKYIGESAKRAQVKSLLERMRRILFG
jgi:Mrp family chromosome partitioning ATPase